MIDLNKEIPGFADPANRQKIIQQIDKYAGSLGFSTAEMQSIKDPRIILLAYKAMTSSAGTPGSSGEYVIPANIVKAMGREFFDKLLASNKNKGK